jgi:hypothetical protein
MTTLHFGQQRGRQFSQNRRHRGGQFSLLLIAFAVIALGAFGYVGYVLWPRWPAPRLDAPALPITVAGVAFNLPPAAIRRAAQRRSGAHERVDLIFLWPSLEPPDPAAKPSTGPHGTVPEASQAVARVFMTILSAGDTLAAGDRALTIYPRYTAAEPVLDASGLAILAFRDGTPYQGEDLIYDAEGPSLLARCTRERAGPTPGTCLYERRIGAADVVVRFPREWLSDWRMVAGTLDRLIASVRPSR